MVHAGGRPTKYKPEFCDLIMEIMGVQGQSFVAFCAEADISKDTGYEWIKEHAEFSDAFSRAKIKCEAIWDRKIQIYMENRDINAPLAKFYMANRFGWSDKKEIDNTTKLTVQPLAINVGSS